LDACRTHERPEPIAARAAGSWGRKSLQTGSAKSVQFAEPMRVGVHHELRATPLEQESRRGEGRDSQQADTEDANTTSRIEGMQ
jgi:hypothetical protein